MGYSFDFHPEAEKELFEAIDYLDDQREGYGVLLAEAAANIFDLITEKPLRFPPSAQNPQIRRATLSKPFHKSYSVFLDNTIAFGLTCLENDKRFVFRAASEAKSAVEYILGAM